MDCRNRSSPVPTVHFLLQHNAQLLKKLLKFNTS